jgi:DNA-binding transcriptional regulator YiaG
MATTKTRRKSATSTKKPKWSVITYKQIESRRAELGLSKSAMAEALGVTNSTYHNWRRGTTVPHPTQQEAIKSTMAKLKPGKAAGRPAGKSTRKAKGKSKATRHKGASRKGSGFRTGSGASRDVSGGTNPMTEPMIASHPLYPATGDPVRSIGHITGAWIEKQTKAPSAGSVFDFVRGLREVLSEEG